MEEEKVVKVAVIGSGLAGLTAAYLLTKGDIESKQPIKFEVHLFEKNEMIGMDAASITIDNDKDIRIDVPMRSFMSGYYSHLTKLYQHLGITSKPAKFSFGWYTVESPSPASSPASSSPPSPPPERDIISWTNNTSYLTYSGSKTIGRLHIPSSTTTKNDTTNDYMTQLFSSWWIMLTVAFSYTWLMVNTLWLHYRGHLRNPHHPIANMTLGQWFQQVHIQPYFIHHVFIPLFAAVCTNSWKAMLEYPATEVLEYMAMGLFQESYVVTQGVRQVVEKLAKPISHIHLNTCIQSIQPKNGQQQYGGGEEKGYILTDEKGNIYECDHLIFATQANQAYDMLKQCYNENSNSNNESFLTGLKQQMAMLKKFNYDKSLVINHTDSRLLPSDKNQWRALNLAKVNENVPTYGKWIVPFPYDTTMTTHIINMTHSSTKYHHPQQNQLYLQTTNPCIDIDPKYILSVSWFERATVTLDSKKAIEQDLFPMKSKSDREEKNMDGKHEGHDDQITLGPCQGLNGIWFVGSYCWRGIPLLEGCVASSEKVVLHGIALSEGVLMKKPW
ncbi:hypothetical protein BJ944DRAFT_271571 [Cunninghamella echinulata]|nr:hypothetical protein BJ944DRAFT_271571 [Cunninghamella echinulata]